MVAVFDVGLKSLKLRSIVCPAEIVVLLLLTKVTIRLSAFATAHRPKQTREKVSKRRRTVDSNQGIRRFYISYLATCNRDLLQLETTVTLC